METGRGGIVSGQLSRTDRVLVPPNGRSANVDRFTTTTKLAITVAGALAMAACGTGDFVIPTAEPSSSAAATTSVGPCMKPHSPQNEDEKNLTAAISELQFPVGTCFFMVDIIDILDKPGEISVTVDLDVAASTSPNDLRPVATDIAYLLKGLEIARRIAVVDITNRGAVKPRYRTLLTDESFQENSWIGVPSRESDMAIWKIVKPE